MKNILFSFFILILLFTTGCNSKKENFKAKSGTFINEIDGIEYKWVKVGAQIWMAENLRTTILKDGSSIKYYSPDNNPMYIQKYGCLYDWETVKKIVPKGWHIPLSDDELDTEKELFKDLGSEMNIEKVRSKFFSALNMYPIGYMSQGKYLGFGEIASYWMYMHDKITPGEFTLDRIYMQADSVENPEQIANAVRFVKDFNISIKNTGNAVKIDTVYN